MKIVSQNSDVMVLNEGNTSAMIGGAIFTILGLGIGLSAYNSGIIAILVAGVFVLIGLAIVFFSFSINIVINKTSGQIEYRKKRLTGESVELYQTANISRVETQKKLQRVRSTSKGVSTSRLITISQSFIIFKDGSRLALGHQKNNSSGLTIGGAVLGVGNNELTIASTVAQFLGVPFQESGPENSGIIR